MFNFTLVIVPSSPMGKISLKSDMHQKVPLPRNFSIFPIFLSELIFKTVHSLRAWKVI